MESSITDRLSGYGYGCCAELTEVLGTGVHVVQNSQILRSSGYG